MSAFKDESFDYVICIATLHHLLSRKERLLALSELGRVLKREAFITVWDRANPELPDEKIIEKEWGREKLKRKYYLYDKEEFESELRKAGFSGKVWSDGKNLLALVRR